MADSLNSDDITRIAQQEGVDPRYALAIVQKENSKDSDVSGAGAVGRFQILPDTFKAVNPDGDINNPEDNAVAGIRYLKQGLDKNNGDFSKAAAYYYAGPGWQSKVANAPNKKYGTNPDGSGGISIEDYSAKANSYVTGDQPNDSMAGVMGDVDSAIAQLSMAADKQLAATQTASTNLSDRIKTNLQQQVDATRRGGELAATVELDKFRQQQQRAAENAAVLTKLGINTSDIDNVVAQVSAQFNEDSELASQLRADIDEKRSVGFFDDPIQYVVNQFTLNADIRRHNAVIQRMQAGKAAIDQATGMASELQAVNAAKFVPMSLEGAQASAEVLKNKANVDALKIQDSLMKQDYETQARTFGLIQARINNLDSVQRAQINSKVKQDIEARKAAEDERARMDDMQVLTASRMIGMEVPTRKALQQMPKDSKEAIERIMANGGIIGKDPLESLQVLRRGDPMNMPVAMQQHKKMLETAYQQAYAIVKKDPALASAKPQAVQEAISAQMNTTINKAANDPNTWIGPTNSTGTIDNPYHVPNLNTMKGIPEARSLPIAGIIGDQVKNFPNKPVSDSLVMELAYQNIGDGKAYKNVTEAAQDVAKYYKTGIDYNNQKLRFNSVGMPPQENYMVNKVDMSQYSDVVQYYLKKQRMEYNLPEMLLRSSPTGGQ